MKHTHSDRLERWLGAEAVASMSRNMREFYWPVPIHGVPGVVFAMPGGDFTGEIRGGQEVSAMDRARCTVREISRSRLRRAGLSRRQLGAFVNLSAIIAAATGGKRQDPLFAKTGTAANAIGNAMDLWTNNGQPVAGAAGAAAPGGTAPTRASTGAIAWNNPSNSNTGHFITGYATSSVAGNSLLLYDRLFAVAKTMNSTATEAVTGTFSRYQTNTVGVADYIGGNFLFPSNPTTVLAATAHNWTVCQYTNQAGSTAQSVPSIAGISAGAVHAIDLAAGSWFMPLASGDVGVKALTQIQCSALVATGTIDFVIGHAVAFLPCPVANSLGIIDGINSCFNMGWILDNACLGLIEMPKPATTATTYSGMVTVVAE